jgi:hypothetical protein
MRKPTLTLKLKRLLKRLFWRKVLAWLLIPTLTGVLVPIALAVGPGARPASAAAAAPAATAIRYALAQLGKPYRWGGAGPRSFDCSGLTMRAYQAAGVGIPRVARDQYAFGHRLPLRRLRPGDLVFFAHHPHDPATIGHVGLYLGHGRMIEAPRPGVRIHIASIWRPHLVHDAVRPAWSYPGLLLVRSHQRGSAVVDVQERLAANGYCLAMDGAFGPVTRRTVRRFQARYSLAVDGVVGRSLSTFVRQVMRDIAAVPPVGLGLRAC